VFLYDVPESAFFIVMGIFGAGDIVGNGIQFFCFFKNLLFGCLNKFRILVNKVFDEPGAGNAVYFGTFPGYPFHIN